MDKLEKLAIIYKYSTDPTEIHKAISLAIENQEVDSFINVHKDGWIGINGEFARVLDRCINGQYHVRVFLNGELNQEAVCCNKLDIVLEFNDVLLLS